MKLSAIVASTVLVVGSAGYAAAQRPAAPIERPSAAGGYAASQPPGTSEAIAQLTSQPATHTAFNFDHDMLQGMLGAQSAGLNSVTIENFRFQGPVFYVPEELSALGAAYNAAGWKHLVEANVSQREQTAPSKPITDLWLHYHGTEIDDVAVLIRAPKQMNLIEISGLLRPLDLAHLGGHFGLPKVDPDAVMVPAPPGR